MHDQSLLKLSFWKESFSGKYTEKKGGRSGVHQGL